MKNETFDFLLWIAKNAYFKKEVTQFNNWEKIADHPEKLHSLLAFNGLRPAAYNVLNNSKKVSPVLIQKLQEYKFNQITKDLNNKILTRDLILELNANGIVSIPYKGQLFNLFLFQDNPIRESGDIDLLIHPDSIKNGISFLIDSKYNLVWLNKKDQNFSEKNEVLIEKIVSSEGKYEFSFQKNNDFLDVHWGLTYGFLPYQIPYNRMFENLDLRDFYGKQLSVPSIETILWMIILHNGGKELWLKQKHWLDLLSFYEKYQQEINWVDFLEKAKRYKIFKITLVGFFIINKYFNVSLNEVLTKEVSIIRQTEVDKIIKFMSEGKEWKTLIPRFKYEMILMSLQDDGFSKMNYFRNIYIEYSKPNPLEHARILEFDERYHFLNFVSKILTYLIRKFK